MPTFHLTIPRSLRVAAAIATLGAAVAACADDAARQGPVAPAAVVPRDGIWQSGTPGAPLANPLVVAVLDARGAPVQGAVVRWTADDGGVVTPATSITDAGGEARTSWTLGGTAPHQVRAEAADGVEAKFEALVPGEPPTLDVPLALDFATYDGSRQVVHPDFAAAPVAWGTGPRQLAITPYPFGNSGFENPSLFVGPDEVHWAVPDGGTNPIVRPGGSTYLSDPDVVFDPAAGELRLYYRAVDLSNRILLTTSHDGVHWGASVELLRVPNHAAISPAVVRRGDGDWSMWTVDGGASGCDAASTAVDVRHSADGVHWSPPTRARLVQPGFSPWHIDVQWIPSLGEYWALYNGKAAGDCATPALFFARSADGVAWTTYPSPVLARGAIPEFLDVVYRSTFAYDPADDVVTLWYSGARYDGSRYVWRAAVERRSRADLMASVVAAAPIAARSLEPRPGVPPLLDGP